jgi:hypothetical protein
MYHDPDKQNWQGDRRADVARHQIQYHVICRFFSTGLDALVPDSCLIRKA